MTPEGSHGDDSTSASGSAATTSYSPALDGLRAVSVLAVLAFHNAVLTPRAFENQKGYGLGGFLGVTVFFALSGYLITRLLLDELDASKTISLRRFYRHRVVRLYPALLVLVALMALIWPILRPPAEIADVAPAVLLQYSNWVAAYRGFAALDPLGPCWSLAVEWQFYLIWPCIVALLWKVLRLRAGAVAVLLAAAGILAVLRHDLTVVDSPLSYYPSSFVHADTLTFGAAAALSERVRIQRGRVPWFAERAAGVLAWGMFGILIVLFNVCELRRNVWLKLWGYTPVSIFAAWIVAHLAESPRGSLARVLAWRPLVALGKRAYGLYLYQLPVLFLLLPARVPRGSQSIELSTLFYVGASLGMAWLSYGLVETPCRRWLRGK